MKVSIWDMYKKKWVDKTNIKYIVDISPKGFKLDGVEYDKSRYELQFIHSEAYKNE